MTDADKRLRNRGVSPDTPENAIASMNNQLQSAGTEMLPCIFCGRLTGARYSPDLDLRGVPACNAACFQMWMIMLIKGPRA